MRTMQNWHVEKPSVRSTGGLVAAQSLTAAEAGASALAAGGNAVDAAVTTAFALAATEPWMSGLVSREILLFSKETHVLFASKSLIAVS